MATIKSQLTLIDGMSAPIRAINKTLETMISTMEKVSGTSENAFDPDAIVDMKNALADAENALGRLGDEAQDTSGSLMDMVKSMGLLRVAEKAISGIANTLKAGVNYASDLAEVQNVVDVTFDRSAEHVNRWAKEALDAYGMNEVSAKRYAGTMGAMLKSSGIAGDAVTDMSEKITGLAGDMASFYNLDLETAFEKIRSGISGETEPLRQLGINMNVANLESYALSQGIEKSYNEMSQAEQVLLRYNYLMAQTADAQGDFARTQDSWANQTRLLSENWRQFTGVLAEQFLPMLTVIVNALNNVIGWLTENADVISSVAVGIIAGAAAWGIYSAAVWLSVPAHQAALQSAASFFSTLLTNPFTWIAVLIGVVIGAIYNWIQSVGGLSNAWTLFKTMVSSVWAGLKRDFFTLVYGVLDMGDQMRLGIVRVATGIGNAIGDMRVNVLNIIQSMVNGAVDLINKLIGFVNQIPGVSIDTIEHVTFAADAAVNNEALKQAGNQNLADFEDQIAEKQAEREAKLADLRSDATVKQNRYNTLKNLLKEPDTQPEKSKAGSPEEIALDYDAMTAMEGIGGNTGATAANTGSMAETAEISEENLKYLKDMAEQEVINRFTTAEIKVDMTNNNSIASGLDLDGIISSLSDGVYEAMEVAAEGAW